MSDIANRLANYIGNSGYTINSFAKYVGIDQANLSKMAKGKLTITPKTINKISSVCSELDTHWLLTGEGSMIKQPTTTISGNNIVGNNNNVSNSINGNNNQINAHAHNLTSDYATLNEKIKALEENIRLLEERNKANEIIIAEKDKLIAEKERLINVLMKTCE